MSSTKIQVEAIIFKIVGNEIFFLLLKRNEQKGGFWQPVTGGVEEGETLVQAVNRELWEETDIIEYIRMIQDVYYFEFDIENFGTMKEYVFGIEISLNTKVKISPEHTEMKWCSFGEAMELLKYESNKIAFEKLYERLTA
jgi:dihydroneopterin triphosphate diphosphatase